MTDRKLYALYGGVFALSVLIFGYALFPSEAILNHLLASFSERVPGVNLQARSLKPDLPLGVVLEGVEARLPGGRAIELQSAAIARPLFVFGGRDGSPFTLEAEGCKIPLKLAFLDLGILDFKTISMEGTLSEKDMAIGECTLSGSPGKGRISGRIAFNSPLEQSRMEVSGELTLDEGFLKTLGEKNKGIGAFMMQKDLRFTLGGTFEKPEFSLKQDRP